MVGTIRKNKPELPPQFALQKSRTGKSSIFGFTEDITLVSYVPKRNKVANLIYTMHHDDAIDVETEEKEAGNCDIL